MYISTKNKDVNKIYEQMCIYMDNICEETTQKNQIGNSVHQYYNLPVKNLFKLYADYDKIVNNSEYRFEFDKMYAFFSGGGIFNPKVSTEQIIVMLYIIEITYPGINIMVDGSFGAYIVDSDYKFIIQIDAIKIFCSKKYNMDTIKIICDDIYKYNGLRFNKYEGKKSYYKMRFDGPTGCIIL